jgi:phosphopantetheine adenylyltransferase
MKNKYALYIGRWQNFHVGHEWLFNQQLLKGKKIWIAIRDMESDENNPKTSQQILEEIMQSDYYFNNKDNILVSIIPDIESVNYGRGVGYQIIEHIPNETTASISGTKIRKGDMTREGQKV